MNPILRRQWVVASGLILAAALLGVTATRGDRPQAPPPDPDWQTTRAGYLAASRAEHDHRTDSWNTVAAWDFDDGRLPETFRVIEGTWRVSDGMLHAIDGEPQHNRTLIIAPTRWPKFRLSFDARLTPRPGAPADRVGDIGIRIGADAQTAGFANRYAVILAHYANQAAVIYRLNIPLVRTEMTPIVPGRTHRVVVEFVKPHIRVWVDDRVVLEVWERAGRNNRDDGDFLPVTPDQVLALHTWDTVRSVDNVMIEVPESGAK